MSDENAGCFDSGALPTNWGYLYYKGERANPGTFRLPDNAALEELAGRCFGCGQALRGVEAMPCRLYTGSLSLGRRKCVVCEQCGVMLCRRTIDPFGGDHDDD